MKDIKKFIRAKKRKRLIKKLTLITIILVVGGFIFITKAPIFNIKAINFKGNVTISNEVLLSEVSDRIGLNIFTVNERKIREEILKNRYVSTVDIKRKGINTLEINITEEAPVYYINNGVELLIINNDLEVLEEVDNIDGRNLVEIKGVDISIKDDESKVDEFNSYKSILTNFYPFISQNRESIYFSSLDLSNIVNIIGYIGNVEILFGDDSDLYNKMENVYRIMLDDNINIAKGYINVSFNGSPVIKVEEVKEETNEEEEGITEDNSVTTDNNITQQEDLEVDADVEPVE
ncbi:cell division protein FtsQ/DivIB [uncultured Clostridium sp.]|uniref:cell division protein FtsQ/DivIB n=1 Tax=uncultured Clostridium sp. TaxID=59620 RepID=UPI0025FC1270|nr:FtsQ-type POTRA domain-containing protein [uncultured Clostridium sp.]MDU4882872.1 FtsQ-type POTRA domain-containing protein [Clostridium celatum]MDU7075766.1 FtsQ-type POTRA domain-containing protein [Clostridium celatum]